MKPLTRQTLPSTAAFILLFSLNSFPLFASDQSAATAPSSADSPKSSAADAATEDPLLVRAISERRILTFNYSGHARIVEPHAYGIATSGDLVLHGYQTSTGGVSGKPPGWRTFVVSEISSLTVSSDNFAGPRSDYTAERPKLVPLWAEVSVPASPQP
jgi:predicted DNA-binding transcriptional regulator YafY